MAGIHPLGRAARRLPLDRPVAAVGRPDLEVDPLLREREGRYRLHRTSRVIGGRAMSGNDRPDERERLLSVAREASAFLDSWFPQTDRFIEATLPLDAALNAVADLLDGDHPGLLEFWGSDCEACEGNTTAGSMRCDDCGSRQHTVALYSVRRTEPGAGEGR